MFPIDLAPKTIAVALAGGVLPALLWLWFFLKEDKDHPEPKGLLLLVFFAGALAVVIVLPIEKIAIGLAVDAVTTIALISVIEEVAKFTLTALIAFRTRYLDEPIDYAMYLMTGGLGFAALENTLFLFNPLRQGNVQLALVTGDLRFLGATILHAAAGMLLGSTMGLAFYRGRVAKFVFMLIGLAFAIAVHGIFNYFITQGTQESIIFTLAGLWVLVLIIFLLLEKLKAMYVPPMVAKA